MPLRSTRSLPRALAAAFLAAACLAAPRPSGAETLPISVEERAEIEATARQMKQIQIARMRDHFRAELRENREKGRELAERMKRRARAEKKGVKFVEKANRARPDLPREAGDEAPLPAALQRAAQRLKGETVNSIPTNVRANDISFEGADACQSEEAIASIGDNVLVAWNDGGGSEEQGWGYSTDGGQTFTDGDGLPILAGATWISDPVVVANPTNGYYYFTSLFLRPTGAIGIGVIKGSFSGASFIWGAPVIVREVNGTTRSLDKEWIAVDPDHDYVYISSTMFTASDDSIEVQRSLDGGATWSGPSFLNDPAAVGLVQGSRPIVGVNGEVYVVYYEIGLIDVDFLRIVKSTNFGASYGSPITVASFFSNYGGGAPGFNREQGIQFPSIAVNRTFGPNRGRLHVTWNESINFYNDALSPYNVSAFSKSSVENDNFFSRANVATMGHTWRGNLIANDLDYFAFSATAGNSYMFYCDSVPRPLYTMRVFCGSDTTSRLAYSGDVFTPTGDPSLFVWTAPSTGTHYLRMAWVNGGTSGNYRVRTAPVAKNSEPGRDQRDIMTCFSSNAGVSWSTPARVNDDLGRFDNWLPEIAVGPDGFPYISWFDWRDHACGGQAHQYASRSTDGGTTWAANQRFTDVQSNWTASLTNLAPNQGDYIHITSDERYVRPTWADVRGGNPDVYTTAIDTRASFTTCPDDTTISLAPGTELVQLGWNATNGNPLFTNSFKDSVSCSRNWPLPSQTTYPSIASNAAFGNSYTVAVPDSAVPGTVQFCVTARLTNGLVPVSCCFNVTLNSSVGVEDGVASFALFPATPNPAFGVTRIGFSLPREGGVELRIYGLQGERVRTLASGNFGAGAHTLTWDGRDDQGRKVAAGTYFYKLVSQGQSAVRRLVWMK